MRTRLPSTPWPGPVGLRGCCLAAGGEGSLVSDAGGFGGQTDPAQVQATEVKLKGSRKEGDEGRGVGRLWPSMKSRSPAAERAVAFLRRSVQVLSTEGRPLAHWRSSSAPAPWPCLGCCLLSHVLCIWMGPTTMEARRQSPWGPSRGALLDVSPSPTSNQPRGLGPHVSPPSAASSPRYGGQASQCYCEIMSVKLLA